MQSKVRGISSAQLVMVLFISRFFTLMTYVPATQASNGSVAMLNILLSSLLSLVVILPFFWLYQKSGTDLLTSAFQVGRIYGIGVAALFGLFCLYMTMYSVNHFEFFMTSTIYQNEKPWIFIICMVAVAAYGAKMGLEALSRVGVLVFFIITAVLILLLVVLLPEANTVHVVSPLIEGYRSIAEGTYRTLAGNVEFILFMLLIPRVKQGGKKTFFSWIVLITVAYEVLTFLTLTVLGDYARTRMFPLYSAASVAQVSVFGRLDLLHICTWVFVAFVRITLYLYCGNVCLRRIFPKLSRGVSILICAVTAGGAAMLTITQMEFWQKASWFLYTGIPFGVLVVAFPLVTMLFPKVKKTA